MLTIAGTIRFPQERIAEVRTILEPFVNASRAEAGNLHYAASFDPFEPGLINIFEAYVDQAAIEAHRSSDHMATWRAAGAEIGVGGRELYLYDVRDRSKL